MRPKQLLLFVLFTLFASVAKAQWQYREHPYTSDFQTDTEFYLYNVESKQYFLGANAWGTQASVGVAGYKVKFTVNTIDDVTGTTDYVFSDFIPTTSRWMDVFIADADGNMYVDRGTQGNYFFHVDKVDGEDYYRITASYNNEEYTPEEYISLGIAPGETTVLNIYVDDAESSTHWQFVTPEQYEEHLDFKKAYELSLEMPTYFALCERGGVDVTEERAVYDDQTSSYAAMQAAYSSLKAKYAQVYVNALGPGQMGDVTQYTIVNPDFTDGSNGWTTSGRIAVTNGAIEAYSGYSEFERETGFDVLQTVTLPAGKYTMIASAFFRCTDDYTYAPDESTGYLVAGNIRQKIKTMASEADAITALPTSLDEAAALLATGAYENVLEFESNGTPMQIGFTGTFNELRSWVAMGPVQLFYNKEEAGNNNTNPSNTQWTCPTPQKSALALDGTEQYFYNVEYGGFLIGANDWGTRASVAREEGLVVTVTPGANEGSYVLGQFSPDDADGVWTDGSRTGNESFTFAVNNDQTFTIGNTRFEGTYLTWTGEESNTRVNFTETSKNGTWYAVSVEDYKDFQALIPQVNAYYAAMELKAAIEAAEKQYPGINLAGPKAVYENTSSTLAEINAAKTAVEDAIKKIDIDEVIKNASVENPADITLVIKNPSFEENGVAGWENNGSIPLMIQPNSAFAKTGEYYAERWHVSGTFDLNQSISDTYQLPAGYYRVTADVFSQIDDATIYINGEEVIFGITEGDAEIDRFRATAATYVPAQSTITIGVKGTLTSDTWFCVDNFRLVYYGTEGIGDEDDDEPSDGPEEITEDVPFYETAGIPTPDDAIDLGLSVKWAPYNLGTSATNKYGSHYPLGSLVEQDGTVNQTDAEFNGNTDQELCDLSSTRFDATTDQWGSGWRLPTIDELKELQENVTVKAVVLSGVKGYMVTSNINGNSIFIPSSGRIPFQGELGNVDTAAYLWSGNHQGLNGEGASLTDNGWMSSTSRLSMGYAMRPVYDAKDDYKRNGGIYYLYNKEADMFLERGEAWGGQAKLGNYGLPVCIGSVSSSASADKITRLRMYDTGKSFGLGDNLSDEVFLDSKYSAMRTYMMTTTTDGVTFTDENGLAVYIDGNVLKASASRTPAVWQLITEAEHKQMLAEAEEEQTSDAFAAADVDETADLIETDYTDAIASASLKGSSDGWTWTPKLRVGTHTTSAYCFEGYKAQGTLSQTVTGLEPGLYKLTANAMFRNGSNKFMTDMKADGYTPSTAYLEANGYHTRIASWAEYNTAANVPNSMAEFDQVVTANPDNYKVTLYTVVGDDGQLDISFVQDDFVGYGWFAVNNVQLNLVEEDGYDFPEDAIAQGEVGTCVWYVTSEGELVIAPADGVSGDLPEDGWYQKYDEDSNYFTSAPWGEYRDVVYSANIMPRVNAISCSDMFCGMTKMETADLSNFNTQKVTDMSVMFFGCHALTSLDLSSLNTENVTDMRMMFSDCYHLTSLNLSNFNMQNVTDMSDMFSMCLNLATIISNNETPSTLKAGTFETLENRANCTLRVPTGTRAAYMAANGWNELGIIDDGLIYDLNVNGNVTLASLSGYADKFNVSNTSTGHLTVDIATGSHIGDYVQQAAGSAIFNQAASADKVSVEISLVPKQWKFVSFPYDVKVSDIQKPADAMFAIRKYSGEKRANGEDAWVKVAANETLNANEGYIINADNGTTQQIKMTFPATGATTEFFSTQGKDFALAAHNSDKVANRDWNFLGNPFPSYYTTQSINEDVVLTIWNGNGYTAYSTVDDNYMLKPFESFFIQSPLNVESISLPASGRSHGTATTSANQRRAKQISDRNVLNFVMVGNDYSDRARIVINELASTSYEAGRDAAKFMSLDKSVPQIFVVSNEAEENNSTLSMVNGTCLAIDERPMASGHATLGIYSAEESDYTLSLKTSEPQNLITSKPIYIIDNVTGAVIDLTSNDYHFITTAGTDLNRFTVVLNGTPDGIEEINKTSSMLNGQCYNLAGQRISNAKARKGVVIVNGKKHVITK